MSYMHGIYGYQMGTEMPIANMSTTGVQCVVGTAPVNLISDPASAVNKPILVSSLENVKSKIGYSTDVDKFTLMQAVHSTLEIFRTAPLILINVLDPAKHTKQKTLSGSFAGGLLTIQDTGVVLSSIKLTSQDGSTTYVSGTDYITTFNDDGTVLVSIISGKALTATSSVKASYSILDVTLVTDADIIVGIQAINRAFPIVGIVPEILLAPGYSQNKDVGDALIVAAQNVSCVFKATALVDIDSEANNTIDKAIVAKTTNSLYTRDVIVGYPKVKTTAGVTVYMSAQLGALIQSTDAANESTPFVSPSNKAFKIIAAVLSDGTEVNYTLDEANELNGEGIVTALNFMGWRSWGDNTGIYSTTKEATGVVFDVKDRYISVKRSFDWQNNGFIKRYFTQVDNPLNLRAIQTLITDENQYYNAFIAAGYVAGMSLTYNSADNPIDQILKGTIKFKQYLAPYTPMEVIENTLQFDPTMIEAALTGGSNS